MTDSFEISLYEYLHDRDSKYDYDIYGIFASLPNLEENSYGDSNRSNDSNGTSLQKRSAIEYSYFLELE
jgi:hypothetical protein